VKVPWDAEKELNAAISSPVVTHFNDKRLSITDQVVANPEVVLSDHV